MTETDKKTDQKTGAGAPLYLVDGSGFIFRAYYALPPLSRPDGTPVGAVVGFGNMLLKLLEDSKAENIAVIFDAKRENFRNQIYADYKANRQETPEDLIPQFPIIRELVTAFSVPQVEMEGYEADDLIASYAKLAEDQGQDVIIVSSDKDLMQLIRPGVMMLDPLKNTEIGLDEVEKKFGVAPDRVVDVQALAGDSTDNVPGVPGIGVKTAAQLIQEYGDLESLLARAEEIKQPKRREKLLAHAEDARISKQLVQLADDAPVPLPLADLHAYAQDWPKLAAFAAENGMKALLRRINKHIDGSIPGIPVKQAPHSRPDADEETQGEIHVHLPQFDPERKADYTLIQDEATLKGWIARAHAQGWLVVDTETDSLMACAANLVGVALAVQPYEGAYLPLQHKGNDGEGLALDGDARPEQLDFETALALLKPLLEDPSILKIGHNLKYDMQVLARYGIRLSPIEDTLSLSYVLDGRSHGHSMDELALLHFHYKTTSYTEIAGRGQKQITFDRVPLDQAGPYAAEDADITLRLWQVLRPRLVPEKMTTVYERLERPLIPVIARMETAGIKVDPHELRRLSQDFAMRMDAIEKEIYKLAGEPFNIASPGQMGKILFDKMGIPGGRKSKTGQSSTAVDVLEPLAEEHEIIARILDWRQLAKLKSTYADALLAQINPQTGRVHTSFSLAATSTGRLASSDPNLQNIPIRTEDGRKIRAAFVAEKGHHLLAVDYSQVELRLIAELANVQAMKQAFHEGQDIHATTASQIFHVPMEEMTSDIRARAKAINFGIIYGISGYGLAKQIHVPPNEAGRYIEDYLDRYHEIRAFMEACKKEARQHGYVRTLWGRKCFIPGIHDKNQLRRQGAERQAINAPLQGTAADIIKSAMIRIDGWLQDQNLKTRLLLQVHDELIFEVPDDELDQVQGEIKTRMETAANGLSVPLVADVTIGERWVKA